MNYLHNESNLTLALYEVVHYYVNILERIFKAKTDGVFWFLTPHLHDFIKEINIFLERIY